MGAEQKMVGFQATSTCRKCGWTGRAETQYYTRTFAEPEEHPAEWLQRTCPECGFWWNEHTKDHTHSNTHNPRTASAPETAQPQ